MTRSFAATWTALEAEIARAEHPLFVLEEEVFSAFGPEAAAPLSRALDSDDLRIAFNAGLAIAQLGHVDTTVPLLVDRLADPHPLVARHVMFVVRELGQRAIDPLLALYEARAAQRPAIAAMFGFLGPRARRASEILRRDADRDERIAAALRDIVGPWPVEPEDALPYIGEPVRLDDEGPPVVEHLGMGLWLELVSWHAETARWADEWDLWNRAEWNTGEERAPAIVWCPDQIAIAGPELRVGLYNFDDDELVTTTLAADDAAAFTNQELLWKVLDAQHRLGPCNDRIYEGLSREDDGSYRIETGS